MQTEHVQRWSRRRPVYRCARECINPRDYEVAEIESDTMAREWIAARHYSGTYPAARYRFALMTGGEVVGMAVFSVPCNERALASLPGAGMERIELGRLVLEDRVPANGESWFVARCFARLAHHGIVGVLSFSDPEPREDEAGRIIFPGHVGTVYQALSATYAGRATRRTLRLLPDGTVLSDRSIQKVRAGERGWRAAVETLIHHGAPLPPSLSSMTDFDRREWVRTAVSRVTRPLKHGGNHRYLWALRPRDRRFLPAPLAYPKFTLPGNLGAYSVAKAPNLMS